MGRYQESYIKIKDNTISNYKEYEYQYCNNYINENNN